MKAKFLGQQWIAEFYGCEFKKLNDKSYIRNIMIEAAKKAKATIVTDVFHSFNPQGLSGVVVIAESHMAIHTWPEHGCASVDIFSCGELINSREALEFLNAALGAVDCSIESFKRGRVPSTIELSSSLNLG